MAAHDVDMFMTCHRAPTLRAGYTLLSVLLVAASAGGTLSPRGASATDEPPIAAPIYFPHVSANGFLRCPPPSEGEPAPYYDDLSTEGSVVEVFDGRAYVLT